MRLPNRVSSPAILLSLLALNLFLAVYSVADVRAVDDAEFKAVSPHGSMAAKVLNDWSQQNVQRGEVAEGHGSGRGFHLTGMIVILIGVITILLLWTLSQL